MMEMTFDTVRDRSVFRSSSFWMRFTYRFDPPSIVVAIQRVSHLMERSGHGDDNSRDARQMLEDAMLLQLPAFSVEQAASALASMRQFTPSESARAALLTAVAQHSSGEVQLHQLAAISMAILFVPD